MLSTLNINKPFKALIMVLVCILHCVFQSDGYSNGLYSCDSVRVSHGPVESLSCDKISVELFNLETREYKTCYEPNTLYNVTLTSHYKLIYGILILQDWGKRIGVFPYINHNRDISLDQGLTTLSSCDNNAVSHSCNYSSKGEWLRKCSLGLSVEIPYLSPNDCSRDVEFRYSVVFRLEEFVEDKVAKFSPCKKPQATTTSESTTSESTTTEPTTEPIEPTLNTTFNTTLNTTAITTDFISTTEPPPQTCNASDFNITNAIRALRNCPNNPRWRSDEEQNITENGIVYRCIIEGSHVRKKFCSTGCSMGNKTLCCRIEFVEERMRNFTCSPVEGNGLVIRKTLKVYQQRKCQCFSCSDVCPVPEQATTTSKSNLDTNSVVKNSNEGSSDSENYNLSLNANSVQ